MQLPERINRVLRKSADRCPGLSGEDRSITFHVLLEKIRSALGRIVPSQKFKVGVDIGTGSSSFVILERVQSRWILAATFSVEYTTEHMDEALGELAGELESSLLDKVGRWGYQDIPVMVAISGKNEVVKRIVMPVMGERELKEALRLRFEREGASLSRDVGMGYRIEKERTEGDERSQEVTVSLVKMSILEECVKIFESAGFTDIRPVASSLTYRDSLILDEPYLFLDMGQDRTGFYASVPGMTALYREVGIGGSSLTEALTGRYSSSKGVLELSQQKAERLKKKYGISIEQIESDVDAEEVYEQIPEILKSELDKLVAEIKRTVNYMKTNLGSAPAQLILAGGGSCLPGISDYLRDTIGVEVNRLDYPQTALMTGSGGEEHLPAHLVFPAVSASLTDVKQSFLIPPAYRVRRFIQLESRIFRYAVASIGTFIIALSFMTGGMSKKTRIDSVLMNYSTIMASDLGTKARDLDARKQELSRRAAFLDFDLPPGLDIVTLLREFSHITPEYVILTKFEVVTDDSSVGLRTGGSPRLMIPGSENENFEGPVVLLEGTIDAEPLFLEAYFSKFNRKLLESGLFDNVKVISWERGEENRKSVLTFSLMCSMAARLEGV